MRYERSCSMSTGRSHSIMVNHAACAEKIIGSPPQAKKILSKMISISDHQGPQSQFPGVLPPPL